MIIQKMKEEMLLELDTNKKLVLSACNHMPGELEKGKLQAYTEAEKMVRRVCSHYSNTFGG